MPIDLIWAVVTGGSIMTLLFSVAATWITGKFKQLTEPVSSQSKRELVPLVKRTILLFVVVWPLIYFLAGYFIAWQFADVRLFYSGTTEMAPFLSINDG